MLVSDFTFIATVNPISYVGASPVLVDADMATWNIDPHLIAEALETRARQGARMPKAVMVAHVLGMPADLSPIADVCSYHGVTLIEDAAEALGAEYTSGPLAGHQVGTIGRLGCFSFNGNKIITTGGGGMIATADGGLASRARHLSTQARLPGPEYLHDEIGFNYRLTNINAALGVAQLELLDSFIERKRAIASRYDDAFQAIPGVTVPPRPPWAGPTMWMYSILVDPSAVGIGRRAVVERLSNLGIEARAVWAPAHLMPFYKDALRLGGPVGERLFAHGLSLPCSVSLTAADQERVIDALLDILSGSRQGPRS